MAGDFEMAKAYIQFDARDVGAVANGIATIDEHFKKIPASAEAAVGGVAKVEEGLHGLLTSLRGFREVIGLGLGVGIGRQLFEQIHEGVSKIVEETEAAREAGLSWGDSFSSGLEKLVGMKTALEEILELKKETKEISDQQNKLDQETADIIAKSRGEDNRQFPDVPGGDAKLQQYAEARKKAQADLVGPEEEENKAKLHADALRSQGAPQFAQEAADDALKKLVDEHENLRKAEQAAEQAYRDTERDLKAEQERKDAINVAQVNAHDEAEAYWMNLRELAKDNAEFDKELQEGMDEARRKAKEDQQKENELFDRMLREGEEIARANAEKQKKADEEHKRNADEAQRILKETDPVAALKKEFEEIERLVGTGDLTRAQADKAEKLEKAEAAKAAQKEEKELGQHPEFMGPEQFAKHIQEGLSQDTTAKEHLKVAQEASGKLDAIVVNTANPPPAAMVA
jgi:DNA repair exonuclease SbcCD ATPase subunit